MKIVIVAGGRGTRLGLTDRPKPMVEVAGKPLLERLVEVGKRSGFTDFAFLTGYRADVIERHFGDGSRFGIRIDHVREIEPQGTAGALRGARALLTEPFIVLYGDLLIDVDLADLALFHRAKGGVGSLFVHPNDHPHDSDLVEVDGTRILRFLSKPHPPNALLPNLVSGAIYALRPDALDHVPADGPSDWGKDVFPAMLAKGAALHAYRSIEYAKDIGTPDRLALGEADLASGRVERLSRRRPKPAIFLDRDGVLNEEIDGVHRAGDLVLRDGVGGAVRRINRAGIPAICVTNQPDLAKGKMTFADFRSVCAALDTLLARHGAYLDDLYYCPHHPEKGWPGEIESLKIECACRKPKPGMLRMAARDHNLDLTRSWLIGDRHVDVAAAQAAGAASVLIAPEGAGLDGPKQAIEPSYVTGSLDDAVTYVLRAMS